MPRHELHHTKVCLNYIPIHRSDLQSLLLDLPSDLKLQLSTDNATIRQFNFTNSYNETVLASIILKVRAHSLHAFQLLCLPSSYLIMEPADEKTINHSHLNADKHINHDEVWH